MINKLVIDSNSDLLSAMKKIDKNAEGIIFVIENYKVIGCLTDGDIRRALIQGVSLKESIDSICNKNLVKMNINDSLDNIRSNLNDKIKIIPLVDNEDKLVDFASKYRLTQTPVLEPFLGGNELNYVTECIQTNWVSSQGKYVNKFEDEIASYTGSKYVLAVSNGTVALHLALVALGIGEGDEVIVPDITFGATVNAVIQSGAKPVIVDVDKETWNISCTSLVDSITDKTKAIMPVHIYGVPCNMSKIMEIADSHGLYVIEDCAEALGARINGKHVGTFGDIGTFSFFGNKVITCGEGGALIFDDFNVYEKAKVLRDHGMSKDKRYWHEIVGYNYRLTNLQAALGCAQLEQLNDFRLKRKNIFKWYDKYLLSTGMFEKQSINEGYDISYWLYTVVLNIDIDRDKLINELRKLGVDSRPIFYPMSIMPAFIKYPSNLNGNSELISSKGISFPTSVYLNENDIVMLSKAIIDTVNLLLNKGN